MTSDQAQLLQFWGKTPKAGDPPERYHPAIYHMLDVAFVAEALLQHGAPRLRRALLHAWQGCDEETLLAWLPFLIATHDLGKISAAFQGQAKQAATRAQRERLEALEIDFPRQSVGNLYHAEVSAVWIHEHLTQREPGADRRLVWAIRDAMGGHHGRFTQTGLIELAARVRRSERGARSPWAQWRDESYVVLRQVFVPEPPLQAVGRPHNLRAATATLTGFIVWCDWMGSNEYDFPACPELSLMAEYVVEGRQRAARALAQAQLVQQRPTPTYAGFQALFPKNPPRPLQALIDTLTPEQVQGPLLAIIEAPTGEGKTEAALALARRIGAAQGLDEIFFALPTMATSNQMFLRLQAVYRQLYGDSGDVRLTHSQSLVVEAELRHRVRLAQDEDAADHYGASAANAIQWFAGSKKAMLAPFGVGTVDQVELAGLNVRHYALRLFGLAQKVVVIDEVHAYDAYMSTILEATLTWLASLGTSVVLLSATLPLHRHRALAQAYRNGLAQTEALHLPDLPYPSLALYRQQESLYRSCAVFRGEQRFTLRLRQPGDAAAEARYLIDLVRKGGAVARLCNRVDGAQNIYREVAKLIEGEHVLLHARFPLQTRQRNEHLLEELVGKQTQRSADQPIIIVGTQVLEQSLDYDVDIMVSDFAPIDLLLQRAGRLHRHVDGRANRRPARYALPVLEVCLPQDEQDLPDWRRWAAIYEPYILWRTWEVLRSAMSNQQREIVLPQEYRPLIEAVYAAGAPETADPRYAAQIIKAWETYQKHQDTFQAQGRRPLVPDVLNTDAIIENGGNPFIDDEDGRQANAQLAKTRLGERITLVPLYRVNGDLALDPRGTWRLSADIPPRLDDTSLAGIKEILNHAIPVSDMALIVAYREEPLPRERCWPSSWGEVPPLLRSIYPLYLDPADSAIINGRRVTLDATLGLVIEKEA